MQEKKDLILDKKHVFLFLIPLVSLICIIMISNNLFIWKISELDHFYLEIISVVLSMILAYHCLARGFTFNEKFSLFIGLGLFAGGLIDLLHGSFSWMNMGNYAFESYFIPQSWVAGRIVTSFVLMLGIVKFGKSLKSDKTSSANFSKISSTYAIIIGIFSTCLILFSLNTQLPHLTLPIIIHRPYELIASIFFAVGLFYFYKHSLYKNSDLFFNGVGIILLLNFFVSLIISFSAELFDTYFTVAHVLKNVSLFIFIITISSSLTYQYKLKHEYSSRLQNALAQLAVADRSIKQQNRNLEIEIKEKSQKLIKSEKLSSIGELSGKVAHNLRNPLGVIKNVSGALELEMYQKMTDSQKELFAMLKRAIDRMNYQITDVLDFVRVKDPIIEKQKFSTILDHTLEQIDVPPGVDIIRPNMDKDILCDFKQIQVVLINLIKNSIQAIEEKGSIKITLSDVDSWNVIEVEDSGSGIPDEIVNKIFEPLITTKQTGTGLGLISCKSIVEAHGGTINVKTNPTRFTFQIPKKPKIITMTNHENN